MNPSHIEPAPGGPVSPQLDVVLQLARTQTVVMRRLDGALASYHGLSFNDFLLLHHLSQGPGCRLRRVDLAERHGLTASGITRTLLPLEKLGLVERQQEPRDARVAYAALTAAGRELLGHAHVLAEQISKDLLRNSTPAELQALSQALALVAAMAQAR
ncbi:MarR family transcriptional regulator [Massilia sp. Dwa41.01b]|uniref:MarR family winged helix-turn-helix transcriptional regulator n=1 Tax=Massilia sp. Dwa41.01b TaxID=2709302 RepID=UPI0016047DEA|nr:MarR family transcriptional regulator [Massilia sp. Dwa41.01b]QNA89277.1 MarR family transcriptional regulator [Massilia sp. Dwa41.01b]